MTQDQPTPTAYELTDRTFEALVQNAFEVTAIVDETGTMTYVSPPIERVLGWRADELVGKNAFEFIHPDHVEDAHERLTAILEGTVEESFFVATLHKNGSWREMEYAVQSLVDDPEIRGIVVNYRDVTKRWEHERALRESEERYHKAFRSSPDAIALSRLRDGVFLEVNEGFETLTGHTREEMVGKSSLELDHWKRPEDRERLAAILREKGHVRGFEAHFTGKHGGERVGQLSVEILKLGGETCMLSTARDITNDIAARDELNRARELLRTEHEQLMEKNIALRQILEHLQEEKNSYRHDLTSRVENLLRPMLRKLRDAGGRLDPTDVTVLRQRVDMIVNRDVVGFQDSVSTLSQRERDVCGLIRGGHSTREIAKELGLSPETVNKHRQSIRRKLQIDHRGINLASYLRSR